MTTKNIALAAAALQRGEIIAIPTETVYGLAGNIYDETAIRNIFALKKRPFYNPLIVHLASPDLLDSVAQNIPEKARQLAAAFMPGALTLVLQKQPSIPDLVTAGKPTLAVRVPQHPTAHALLAALPFPLAAPSANPFGCISPTTAAHVAEYFADDLSVILDGGICEKGVESTIIGFQGEQPILYRFGALELEAIEAIVGKVLVFTKDDAAPAAPGMLSKHYAPRTKTILTDDLTAALSEVSDKKVGLLLFDKTVTHAAVVAQEILSAKSDLTEATANLYSALHRLDAANLDLIIAEKLPNIGLGRAMNDRLTRAASE